MSSLAKRDSSTVICISSSKITIHGRITVLKKIFVCNSTCLGSDDPSKEDQSFAKKLLYLSN